MGFKIPEQIENYLNNEWRKPPTNFINSSLYYANLDPFFINYMNTVIRPCMAYTSGAADMTINSGLKMNIGYSIKKTAVRLIKGDKIIIEGRDTDSKLLLDTWAPSVGFDQFLESAIDYMLDGTCLIKLNKDRRGRCVPVATRCDRYYAETDEEGNIYRVTIFNSFLYNQKYGAETQKSYWLVEQRYYKNNKAYVRYKVEVKSGIAGQEILPTIEGDGIPFKSLPNSVRDILNVRGIRVNKDLELPFRDGLGVWLLRRTATNSCVPGLAMGDPLLYGVLDLLWAVDVVFSGSLTDVIQGKGKILVPKKYLKSIRQDFIRAGMTNLSDKLMCWNSEFSDSDDSLVYIATEHDKDFIPQSVQFNIRAEDYKGMLEIYLRQIVSHCGFAPTTIFPFLVDGSLKTATEVTAEENLTRSTVQSLHLILSPVFNRLLNEVLYQLYSDCGEEYNEQVNIKLSDYIGNPILRDQNIRDNYAAGLIPHEIAVQRVNGINDTETQEYLSKIEEDRKSENPMGDGSLDELYKGIMEDDNSEQTAEQTSIDTRRSGNENKGESER